MRRRHRRTVLALVLAVLAAGVPVVSASGVVVSEVVVHTSSTLGTDVLGGVGSYADLAFQNGPDGTKDVVVYGQTLYRGYTVSTSITDLASLVVGDDDAAGRLFDSAFPPTSPTPPGTNPVSGSAVSGVIRVRELSFSPDGAVTAMALEWDATDATGTRVTGSVRYGGTTVAQPGLSVDPAPLDPPPVVEVGRSADRRLVVTNRGTQAAAVGPVSVTGPAAAEWTTLPTSTCDDTPLAPQASCVLDVRFAPAMTDRRAAVLVGGAVDGIPLVQVPLTGTGVGTPGPPTGVTVEAGPLGVVARWTPPEQPGGSTTAAVVVERSTDGVSWEPVVRSVATSAVQDHLVGVPVGVQPGRSASYRLRVEQAPAAPGQTTVYVSPPSAPVTVTGATSGTVAATWPDAGLGAWGIGQLTSSGDAVTIRPTSAPRPAVAVSADGRRLAYVDKDGPSDRPYRIVTVPLYSDSTAPPTVVTTLASPVDSLAWSPDGSQLAYAVYPGQNWFTPVLFVVPAGGGTPVDLEPWVSMHRTVNRVAWLSDGRTVLAVDPDGRTRLLDRLALTTRGSDLVDPVVSPDGTLVVVRTGAPNPVALEVHRFDTAGTRLGALVATIPRYGLATFTPDGRTLVVESVANEGTYSSYPLGPDGQPGAATTSYGPMRELPTALAPSVALRRTSGGPASGVTLTGAPAGATTSCTLDSGAPTACTGTWTAPALAPGRHVLTVTTRNGQGATTSVQHQSWDVGAGLFSSSVPVRRVLDTRTGVGAPRAPLTGGRSLVLTVPGLPPDATAVSLNVVAVGATAPTYLTVYGTGSPAPTSSNLNVDSSAAVVNLVTVPVGPGGRVTITNAAGSVQVLADLQGVYRTTSGSRFTVRTPTRVLDTRSGLGGVTGPVTGASYVGTSNLWWTLLPTTSDHVLDPPETGYATNVTVASPTGDGWLTVGDYDAGRPASSNLNFSRGQTVANMAVLATPRAGNSSIALWPGGLPWNGSLQAVVDVLGAFSPSGASYTALAPTRIADTRSGLGLPRARVPAGGSVTVAVPGLPATAEAVALNVTAVAPGAGGYLTAYPAGTARPTASTVNFRAGHTATNATVVGVDPRGLVTVTNGSAGPVDLLLDLQGYDAP